MKLSYLITALISVSAITAFALNADQINLNPTDPPAMQEPSISIPAEISTTGTMRYQEMEGGFWGIVADDGGKYDPLKLDEKFQKEGLRVRFKAMPEPDMMSTHMWGTIVNLRQIEKIK